MSEVRAVYVSILTQIRRSGNIRNEPEDLMSTAISRLEEAIRAGKEVGDVRANVEPRRTAEMLVLVGIGLSVWDGLGLRVADPPGLVESLLVLIEKPRDR